MGNGKGVFRQLPMKNTGCIVAGLYSGSRVGVSGSVFKGGMASIWLRGALVS
jgi:hypothetical protein